MLYGFTATCFGSYTKSHHQADNALKKNYYVNYLILLFIRLYIIFIDLLYIGFKKVKKSWKITFLRHAANFPCTNGRLMRRRRWKNTAGWQHSWRGCHTAAGQVPLSWSLDLNWIPLLTRRYLAICWIPTQIRIEQFSTLPYLPEINSCPSRGVSIVSH